MNQSGNDVGKTILAEYFQIMHTQNEDPGQVTAGRCLQGAKFN